MPTPLEWSIAILLPLALTCLSSHLSHRTNEPSYALLLLLYLFLDASLGHLFHETLSIPARHLARRLPGVAENERPCTNQQEEETNDPTLSWPNEEALAALPKEWIVEEQRKGREAPDAKKQRTVKKKRNDNLQSVERSIPLQPYYLNHVRGYVRLHQASQRAGAALGTMAASFLVGSFTTWVDWEDVGLTGNVRSDLVRGFFVGASVVTVLFLAEWRLGWVRIVGYWDTVDPDENFLLNFTWDVLFHIGVSVNEEVMMRGWMFVLCSRGIGTGSAAWFTDARTAASFAIVTAILLQSALFAMLHFHSPGSNVVSLVNLFVGGMAASFNFLVAGGTLWLGIGWHFGWNIVMGHVLGRSTSGIPMSCAVVNVVPRPCWKGVSYEKYHGGMFGPERGVLAPLAYGIGVCMMIYMYGLDGLVGYRESLALQLAKR